MKTGMKTDVRADLKTDRNPSMTTSRKWTRRRGWPTAAGVAVGIVGITALAAGGYALSAANSDGGYVGAGNADFRGSGYAVSAEKANPADDFFGLAHTSRIRVTAADASKPIFVGLATPEAFNRYLAGVAYDVARGAPKHHVAYTAHPGSAPATPPAQAAGIWTLQASGKGTQTLQFPVAEQNGDRILVAMNADGSPVVAGHIETADTVPSLAWIAPTALGAGVLLTAGAGMLILKRGRKEQSGAELR